MEEKLFGENISLKELERTVNKIVKEDMQDLLSDDTLEKWNVFPVIFLEENDRTEKILEIVKYIDNLNLDKLKKMSYILTLIYLIEKESLNLDMDINNIYLLIEYADSISIKKINKDFKKYNDEDLLFKIRTKSLDSNIRCNLLRYVNNEKMSVKDAIKFISETEYYSLIEKIS